MRIKGKRDLVKVYHKIFITAFVLMYIASFMNIINTLSAIDINTSRFEKELSANEVKEIDEKDIIYLKNGKVIQSDLVESYIKVNSGSGTWYISGSRDLVVEVTWSDLLPMIVFHVILGVVLVILIVKWVKYSSRYFKVLFIPLWVVGMLISVFCTWGYLSDVLNI